jgi:hypothetical protein
MRYTWQKFSKWHCTVLICRIRFDRINGKQELRLISCKLMILNIFTA